MQFKACGRLPQAFLILGRFAVPKQHGKDTSVYLENTSAACTSVSGDSNSATFDYSREGPEITSFGDNTRQNLSGGLMDWEISVDGFNNVPDSTGCMLNEIINTGDGITVVSLGFAGSATGDPKLLASALLTEANVEAAVDGAETFSFTLVPRSGSMTHTSFA